MTTSATPSGVPDSNADQNPNLDKIDADAPREPTARELAMEAIASGHNDRMTAEFGTTEAVKPAPAEVDTQLAKQLAATDHVFADDSMLIKTKIDGEEGEATVAEMRAAYQKRGAAERRLEEATRLLNEARATKTAAVPPVGVEATAKAADSPPNETAKDFLAALFQGDEGKALEALSKVGFGRQQPTLDPVQLAAQLTPAIKQQLVVESALDRFAVDYADIVKDPYLADLADSFLDAEVKGGKPFTEALEQAGKKTRDWLSSKSATAAEPNPTIDRNTKLERKAGIDTLPALNSKATTTEEPVQSASDVIAEMRKARGLEV